jgi:hypothetical protein
MRRSSGGKYVSAISLLLAVALVAIVALTSEGWAAAQRRPDGFGRDQQGQRARGYAAEELLHNFYFTRGIYSGGRSWATDAPQADRWIASVVRRLTLIDIAQSENYVALDDPDLGRFPFLYILEVGGMRLRESEAEGLRNYILKGGFVMVDDFWGTGQWLNWEDEMRWVLPEYEIVDIPLTHPIFTTVYNVDEVVQVPVVDRGCSGGPTWQSDGRVPYVRGIFDEDGRLMVVINWNTDLGDAWEWAEAACYPLFYSTYAYQVAVNTFMYAMTH